LRHCLRYNAAIVKHPWTVDMTAWQLRGAQTATVVSLSEQLHPAVLQRLYDMGIQPGLSLTCRRRTAFSGPIVIEVAGMSYAIEQTLAESIGVVLTTASSGM